MTSLADTLGGLTVVVERVYRAMVDRELRVEGNAHSTPVRVFRIRVCAVDGSGKKGLSARSRKPSRGIIPLNDARDRVEKKVTGSFQAVSISMPASCTMCCPPSPSITSSWSSSTSSRVNIGI